VLENPSRQQKISRINSPEPLGEEQFMLAHDDDINGAVIDIIIERCIINQGDLCPHHAFAVAMLPIVLNM